MISASASEEQPQNKPRLLVIPHLYAENIVVREIELARRLTKNFEVFLLKWSDALHVDAESSFRRRIRQIAVAGGSVLRSRVGIESSDGLTLIEPPVWQPLLFQRLIGHRLAKSLCARYNCATLRALLNKFGITHLLMASELFGVKRTPGVRTFFDIVDWFPEEDSSPARVEEVRANIGAIAKQVDAVFAVSESLVEKLNRDCGIHPLPLPNGADFSRLRSVEPARVRALREKLGIHDKFVIGYIGNHGSYTGVDLVVNAFLAARARIPDSVLLIVGPADFWRKLLDVHRDSHVIATGSVSPSEAPAYFNAIDLGVLAQGRTAGTDYAFQIKMVEYSACRKCVVSTPLLNWQRLAWPNVILVPENRDAWADAFVRARSISWQNSWDRHVEAYDWNALAAKLAATMLSPIPCAS